MWIPVDPVPLESTLEFVAPHLGPWLMPRTFMDKEAKWFPEGSLADLPDIEGDRAAFPIRRWALGSATWCFRMLTLHASGGTQNRRRAFSIRFVGDDIRHAPRRWKTSPDFPPPSSCPTARRSITRCFRSCGRVTRAGPRDLTWAAVRRGGRFLTKRPPRAFVHGERDQVGGVRRPA